MKIKPSIHIFFLLAISGASGVVAEAPDKDNDGIPDTFEKKKDFLDPQAAADAQRDHDGDTFTNEEEYQAQTELQDPASHPLLACKLKVVEISVIHFPIKCVNISYGEDKNDYFFRAKEKEKLIYATIGDKISVPASGKEYRLIGVKKKTKTIQTCLGPSKREVSCPKVKRIDKGKHDAVVLCPHGGYPEIGHKVELVQLLPEISSIEKLPHHTVSTGQTLMIKDTVGHCERYSLKRVEGESQEMKVILKHKESGKTVPVKPLNREIEVEKKGSDKE